MPCHGISGAGGSTGSGSADSGTSQLPKQKLQKQIQRRVQGGTSKYIGCATKIWGVISIETSETSQCVCFLFAAQPQELHALSAEWLGVKFPDGGRPWIPATNYRDSLDYLD